MGGFAAVLPTGQPVEVSGKKNRALLTYLALHADKKLTREKLISLLWSDRGETQARTSLRQALAALRRDLGAIQPPPLTIDGGSVALDGSAVSTDVAMFEKLATSASAEELRRVAKLYEGDLLDGLGVRDPGFEDWLAAERARLREVAIGVLDRLTASLAGAEAVAVGQRLVALDPLREASHRALMRAYAGAGEKALALHHYARCRDLLRAELGVMPARETEELHQRLLQEEARPALAERAAPKPLSIAVLPFINMSGDPEQEYFSDGITEDIITDLSKVSAISVLSRNASFAFKGRAIDIAQIARQLKVSHVVEGSVRKASGRVRITAQLIDATNDSHVWAERYDRDLKDIFALQDEISRAIVAALMVKLLPDERKAIEARSTQNPKAYRLYLLARYYRAQLGPRPQEIAIRFCRRALEIDTQYARAWALQAICQASLYVYGLSEDSGLSAAEHALALDPSLAEAHVAKGRALYQLGRHAEAVAAHEESLRLEPDSYEVRAHFGLTCMYSGRYEAAIEHFERAAQLLDADYICLGLAAACYHKLGRDDECRSALRRNLVQVEKEIALKPDNAFALTEGAIDLAYLGEKERGLEWISRALLIEPEELQDHFNAACALALLGEPNQALDQLEYYAKKMPPERVNWVKRDPDLQPLRQEPRYQALVAQCEARLAQAQAECSVEPT
jgi:adenylate cyclase